MVIKQFRPNRNIKSARQFEQFIEPHLPHLYQLAYRFCNNQADAEDLVQDVVIKLLSKKDEMSRIEKLRPWLAKILYHQFVDLYRQKERSALGLVTEDENLLSELVASQQDSDPEHHMEMDIHQRHLQHAMQSLNEDQRTVILLHDVEGYTLTELEGILECPLGTLKSRLNRARQYLREKLQKI
ncbi:MAG: RNA polymerase sigma factor [Gammaproteobacteria bacterium]|nr:RNA polymerase sigma factor [Gammaproteobacteria bacterium]